MGQTDLTEPMDAPHIEVSTIPRLAFIPDKNWHAERVSFYRLLPELLKTHKGEYVAILGGAVVAHGGEAR